MSLQFNSHADNQDLVSDIKFLLGVNTSTYPLTDMARNVNERFRQVWQWIFESYGGWQFMDDNSSDTSTGVPEAAQNLTSGTGTYGLPSAALTVRAIECKDSGGNWIKIKPISLEEINNAGYALDDFESTSSTPKYYYCYGDIVRLFPVPNYSQTNGLKVQFDQDISSFASTDTTKVPGFAGPFHRVLSVGAALDYATANGMTTQIQVLSGMWADYEKRIKEFYSKRFKEKFPTRISVWDLLKEAL